MTEIDLTLHVDPTTGKPSGEVEIEKDLGAGLKIDVDAQVDQDGKPTVTIGVKIPF